jgi:hypothetical protein
VRGSYTEGAITEKVSFHLYIRKLTGRGEASKRTRQGQQALSYGVKILNYSD